MGDWLSGRAPRSHRGGHWFDPSIAHPAQTAGARSGTGRFCCLCSSRCSSSLPVEALAQALQRLLGGLGRDLAVNVHRDRDLAVPQDLHCDPRVDVESHQQRRAGTPGVMNPDRPDTGLGAAQGEMAAKFRGSYGVP
jgi:hypothetical protein